MSWYFFCDNDLAPNKPQAIIWTNDFLVYWCKYASPALLDVLVRWYTSFYDILLIYRYDILTFGYIIMH